MKTEIGDEIRSFHLVSSALSYKRHTQLWHWKVLLSGWLVGLSRNLSYSKKPAGFTCQAPDPAVHVHWLQSALQYYVPLLRLCNEVIHKFSHARCSQAKRNFLFKRITLDLTELLPSCISDENYAPALHSRLRKYESRQFICYLKVDKSETLGTQIEDNHLNISQCIGFPIRTFSFLLKRPMVIKYTRALLRACGLY